MRAGVLLIAFSLLPSGSISLIRPAQIARLAIRVRGLLSSDPGGRAVAFASKSQPVLAMALLLHSRPVLSCLMPSSLNSAGARSAGRYNNN